MTKIKNRKWLGKNAKKIKASGYEKMAGGSRRGLTFHDEGVNRRCGGSGSHDRLAKYVIDKRIFYHAIWCPHCGDIIQIYSIRCSSTLYEGGRC